MILHIPHASTAVPAACQSDFLLDDRKLERELLLSTDFFTDELFDLPGAVRVVFPVSRLVVDPERFADDEHEPMAGKGRGVVYTSTTGGESLRNPPTAAKKARLLDRWYHPHHQKLEHAVSDELNRKGRALIVDCHSFPSLPWPVERDRHTPRPEICIGTDAFHTPPQQTEALMQRIQSSGKSVAVNHPYAGSIVPATYYQKDQRVASVMIEIRRDLYMDEITGKKNALFESCRQFVVELLEIAEKWEEMVDG